MVSLTKAPKDETWNIYIDLDLGMDLSLEIRLDWILFDSLPQPVPVYRQTSK